MNVFVKESSLSRKCWFHPFWLNTGLMEIFRWSIKLLPTQVNIFNINPCQDISLAERMTGTGKQHPQQGWWIRLPTPQLRLMIKQLHLYDKCILGLKRQLASVTDWQKVDLDRSLWLLISQGRNVTDLNTKIHSGWIKYIPRSII